MKVDKEIKFIKYFMFVLFAVSSLNFARGMYDFYYTFVHPESHPTRYLQLKEELKVYEQHNENKKNENS